MRNVVTGVTRRTTSKIVGVIALVVAGGCAPSGQAPAASRRLNIVLVCMDTVRADRLGTYGYTGNPTSPRLDQLARRATVFEQAYSTEGWTKPSVASYMTGLYPAQHGVYSGSARRVAGKTTHILPQACRTLAEVLTGAGYTSAAFIHNEHLSRGNGFEQGFAHFEDDLGDARDIRWRALDWLDQADRDGPFFIYLHLLDAHYPYAVPDEYAGRFADPAKAALFRGTDWRGVRDQINGGDRKLDADQRSALGGLYDGSIRYIDDQLARLFDGLRQRGLWDDTVVCVIADHGEEFLEHGRIGHGHGLYDNLLHVPWILRVPRRHPERVSAPVSLVDLYPTLLSAAGVNKPPVNEGINRLADRETRRLIFAEHKEAKAYLQAYRGDRWKLVRRFELAADPSKPRLLSDFVSTGVNWQVELDPDHKDRLRAESLKLRTQPLGAPVEIKGIARDVSGTGMTLAGIAVRFADDVAFSGETETSGLVRIPDVGGAPVKARGDFVDGGFIAERVKVYPADKRVSPTIRGQIRAVKGDAMRGRVRIGDVWIRTDRKSDWLVDGLDLGLVRMEREDINRLLSGEATDGRFKESLQLFDLAADPGELSPRAPAPPMDEALAQLDALGAELANRRRYDRTDETRLSHQSIEKLRAIGYVD